jgi:hypothetical protein
MSSSSRATTHPSFNPPISALLRRGGHIILALRSRGPGLVTQCSFR